MLPATFIGGFGTLDIQIHDYGILPASDYDGFTGHIQASVNLLMRHIGWNVNEVARSGLITKLQVIAPAHAGTATHDVEDCLEFSMVMGSGLGVRVNDYCACP